MALLSNRALDINVCEKDLCLILGYLAAPKRLGLIEAQIPEEKGFVFERVFPNAPYFPITQGKTKSGDLMKQGCQLRIYLNNIDNCPDVLIPFLGVGKGSYIKRINKGKFVERIVLDFGFSFGEFQNAKEIRRSVERKYPQYMDQFEKGYNL